MMNVTFHGVRGSTPCHGEETSHFGGNTSCVSLRVPQQVPIIFDLGTGLRYFGKQYNGTPAFRAVCLLTHLHYDHTLGLPFFEPLLHSDTTLEIYGPKQADGSSIRELFLDRIKPPMFPVPLADFAARVIFHEIGDDDFAIGDLQIRSRFVPHIGPTLGFRVTHVGASVTYLSDHQQPVGDEFTITKGAHELCAGADLLIHDAQFTDEEFAGKSSWGHSTYAYAQWIAETCDVKQLALFHHDPSRTDAMLTEMTEKVARTSKARVVAAREGESIDVVTCSA
ncbi:MAG: MBL fold metallo-hydrolase [Ilumatobacteraceae bacterium]|nr:MBL fold metallo-hydrolase [Ilumatobacteraceae bacterium]